MEPNPQPEAPRGFLRGGAGLTIALAVVVILLVMFPAYRWFFLISATIGIVVAGILHLWHKYKPLKEEDVEHKKPLGLS